MMAILSLYANTARQAIIYAILFWVISAIFIAMINSQLPSLAKLIQLVLPGAQLSMMINTHGFGSFIYAPIPLIQAGVLLFLGRIYMNRS